MAWELRQRIALVVMGAVLLACAAVLLARHKSFDLDVIGTAAAAGGFAVLLVALPSNGGEHDRRC